VAAVIPFHLVHERSSVIDWAVAQRTLAGYAQCGDLSLVASTSTGALLAVVDGLGHGPDASEVARRAVRVLDEHSDDTPLQLLERCHRRLRGTRGAAMTIAAIDTAESTVTWLGVGNVEGLLLHATPGTEPARQSLALRGGVVGFTLPSIRPATLGIARNDLVVLTTDGIRTSFSRSLSLVDEPMETAARILAEHGLASDDALVLVARCLGPVA
jgi:hypothetical protein